MWWVGKPRTIAFDVSTALGFAGFVLAASSKWNKATLARKSTACAASAPSPSPTSMRFCISILAAAASTRRACFRSSAVSTTGACACSF